MRISAQPRHSKQGCSGCLFDVYHGLASVFDGDVVGCLFGTVHGRADRDGAWPLAWADPWIDVCDRWMGRKLPFLWYIVGWTTGPRPALTSSTSRDEGRPWLCHLCFMCTHIPSGTLVGIRLHVHSVQVEAGAYEYTSIRVYRSG